MRKSTCMDWFECCLKKYSNGQGKENVINPVIGFVKNVRAGVYDRYSDEEYKELLDEVESFNMLMNNSCDRTVNEAFTASLMKIKLRDVAIEKIAKILTDEYEHVCGEFTSEGDYPDILHYIPSEKN